ncbi:type II toxin-antitoxin system HigB family toxin [Propionivibrio limicola]|uniref:type II toxin-antitoxin system HigB family toxin n=1 Tax=Propionivibrio limicola TaxID=167645 RepID=UPI001292B653|nr:type II toxin-antitoxin system HigB family toxin [Propionivibrio limicola]
MGNRSQRCACISHLRTFRETNPGAEQALKSWFDEVKKADWSQPADIKAQYRSASILKNRRVVFNIKGNDYRLVVSVAYRFQAVYVKFIGTHTEYDAIDAETVEMEH